MGPFAKTKVTLDDFTDSEESAKVLLSKFIDMKATYESAVGEDARQLRKQIEEIRPKLQKELDKQCYRETIGTDDEIVANPEEFMKMKPFHYGLEFYEIFDIEKPKENRGFDVMIGNPPYVDSETMVKEEPALRSVLAAIYADAEGNWDLYIPFFERAHDATNLHGMFGMISANKWLTIGYGKSLRSDLGDYLTRLCNCDEIKVFKDAGNSPVISFFKGQKVRGQVLIQYFNHRYAILARDSAPRKFIELDNWGILTSRYLNTLLRIADEHEQLRRFCDVENPFTVSEAYELGRIIKREMARIQNSN